MENINDYKLELEKVFNALPLSRVNEIAEFYSTHNPVFTITREAKAIAQSVMNYADRRGYGYGEVYYNLNEDIDSFAEDVPELKKQFKHLVYAYFEFLTESKNI